MPVSFYGKRIQISRNFFNIKKYNVQNILKKASWNSHARFKFLLVVQDYLSATFLRPPFRELSEVTAAPVTISRSSSLSSSSSLSAFYQRFSFNSSSNFISSCILFQRLFCKSIKKLSIFLLVSRLWRKKNCLCFRAGGQVRFLFLMMQPGYV